MKTVGHFKSSNKKDNIQYYVYTPDQEEPRAILQISHGMCEYIERYEDFANYLMQRGILVCGNDHLGHGRSAASEKELGYFAEKDGWTFLSEDLYQLTKIIQQKYPNIPYFLLGHSMGSFVARRYLVQYGSGLDGAIISGTSGGNPASRMAILVAKVIGKVKGGKYRSKLINTLAFGQYNKKYDTQRTEFDWLTRNEKIVDKYIEDKYCNFIFTTQGFEDLFKLLKNVSAKEWVQKVPKKLPIYIISGDMDPVGDYGKGVKKVHKRLEAAGVQSVEIKLYEAGRHEMLNETNAEEVFEDIYTWVKNKC